MTGYIKPQPPPARGLATSTWQQVISDCMARSRAVYIGPADRRVWLLLAEDGAAREAFGAAKYGTTHQHDNGRDHAVDAYQEALDGAMYWRAEYIKTRDPAASELYWQALQHALAVRTYLLRRDGR